MKFYNDLSNYYDLVFPYSNETFNMLKQYVNPKSNVLDLACGTGTYTIELASLVNHITGIDLDDKMIDLAKNKKSSLSNVEFICSDMTKLEFIEEKSMDLIYCIGNSIVHLNDKNDVTKLIKTAKSKLKDNGTLVIQIINFNRILKNKLGGLSTINVNEDEVKNFVIEANKNIDSLNGTSINNLNNIKRIKDIEFIRNYKYDVNQNYKDIKKIDFNTKLNLHIFSNESNIDKINMENHVDLLNMDADDFSKIFDEENLKYEFYGNFKLEPYDENSSVPLIMLCTKNRK